MAGLVGVATILDLIQADGYALDRVRGSHHNYTKEGAQSVVTVPWAHKGDTLPTGTAKSIARQAGPHIEAALNDILGGGGKRALKQHVKLLKQGISP